MRLSIEAGVKVAGSTPRPLVRPPCCPSGASSTALRSARASCYVVCSQFGPRERDTCSARLPRRPSQSRLGRRTHQPQRASTSRSQAYKKSPAFTQERPVWFPKNASRCPKESRTKSSLSLVTLNRGPMGSGCCKSAAPKRMRSGYEKMRPVSQKARVRCPLP